MADVEQKMVFGVSPSGTGDGVPLLMLGVPAGAWEHMKDGKTHSFDLTSIGLPIKILVYGAKDHDAATAVITGHMKQRGEACLDQRRADFSIKPTPATD